MIFCGKKWTVHENYINLVFFRNSLRNKRWIGKIYLNFHFSARIINDFPFWDAFILLRFLIYFKRVQSDFYIRFIKYLADINIFRNFRGPQIFREFHNNRAILIYWWYIRSWTLLILVIWTFISLKCRFSNFNWILNTISLINRRRIFIRFLLISLIRNYSDHNKIWFRL